MKIWEAAVAVLHETDNPAVMWGDTALLHAIANRARASWRGQMSRTERLVLQALSREPGILIPGKTNIPQTGRDVRIFRLPSEELAKQSPKRTERKIAERTRKNDERPELYEGADDWLNEGNFDR